MKDEQWFKAHTEYLQTPEWRTRRKAVLSRDRGRCQALLDVCSGQATEVHHLSYRHWRHEPLFDLVAVCHPCHESLTAMDRGEPPLTVWDMEERERVSRERAFAWARRVLKAPDELVSPLTSDQQVPA